MRPQSEQLRNIERCARYRALGNWAWGVSLVLFILALGVAGLGAGNPEIATSSFGVFAVAGFLRWAIAPLLAAAFALIIVGGFLHGLSRKTHGEV